MNLEIIDKWLDNEFGVSYTRLEELHDFVIEQDLKHQEKADKEIERLNNIINSIKEEIESYIDITIDHFETCNEEINFELRNKCRAMREIKEDILKIIENELKGEIK